MKSLYFVLNIGEAYRTYDTACTQ